LPPWAGPLPVAPMAGVGPVRSRKRICIMQHAGQPSRGWAGAAARSLIRHVSACEDQLAACQYGPSGLRPRRPRINHSAAANSLDACTLSDHGRKPRYSLPAWFSGCVPSGPPPSGLLGDGRGCKMWHWGWCRCISVRLRLKMLQKYCYKANMMDSIIAVFITRC
jgi:hypothetical protein